MKPSVGDRLNLEVTKLVHGGLGLARHDGFVVFVRDSAPGDTVRAVVTEVKKNHAVADTLDVVSPSPHRVPHVWPEADVSRPPQHRAGGADLGHLALSFQREVKTAILRESLQRFGGLESVALERVEVVPVEPDANGLHWRTRMTLHVDESGRAGPYAEKSHTVVPVSSLPLATRAIEAMGVHLSDWSGHSRVRLVDSASGSVRLILDEQTPQPIEEKVFDHTFQLTDQTFWQVHQGAAETLFSTVTEMLGSIELPGDADHWDLYGGVGLFSVALHDVLGADARVVSVESDPVAGRFAATNLQHYPRSESVIAPVHRFLDQDNRQTAPPPLGVVVLDPPRSGAQSTVVTALAARQPHAVVYIACDPVALGRDLGLFTKAGYHPVDIRGFDLFPHTHHMEAVALLARS